MNIDAASLVDMGFTILVAITCFKCLIQKREDDVEANPDVSKELRELESSIKFLIDEAGAASRNLDRRLTERKRELETILTNFEDKEAKLESLSEKIEIIRTAPASGESSSDFPNESWERSIPKTNRRPSKERANETADLTRLVEEAESKDSIQVKNASRVKKANSATLQQQAKDKLLLQQAEALREQKETQKGLAKTGIKDPVAYRVAKRLLETGKEIHVVSRKLELTLDQVRALDKLVREERGESSITSNPLLKSQAEIQKEFEVERYSIETEEDAEELTKEAYSF